MDDGKIQGPDIARPRGCGYTNRFIEFHYEISKIKQKTESKLTFNKVRVN